MKLSDDMLFAHPVLSRASGDFITGKFEAAFEVSVDKTGNLDVLATINLNSADLESLLQSGHAGCGFFLVCPQTYENRLVEMAPGTRRHRLNASDFFGTIRLRPVVWTKRALFRWQSESLHSEYLGAADLPTASILALGDEQRFSIDRERLRPFESIFSLAAVDRLENGELAVDTERAKITIEASPSTKGCIDDMRNSAAGRHLLLNAVYLPVVMQVLQEVASDRTATEDRGWFRVFEAKCAAVGVNTENPELLRDAQRLLGLPFRALEADKERLFS